MENIDDKVQLIEGEDPLISHVYDLEVFDIIEKMRTFCKKHYKSDDLQSQLENLDERFKDVIECYGDIESSESVNLERNHLILNSSEKFYYIFLAYKLLTFDLYRIQSILSYHSVLFQGNYYASKGNFTGLVEYYVYDVVMSYCKSIEPIRLDKIATWLESNRRFELQKANTAKRVRFDADFANILSQKLKRFIEADSVSRIFECLFEEEFLGNKVIFKIDALELCLLLKDCRRHKQVSVKNNKVFRDWILERFNVIDNKNDTLNKITVLNYLNREIKASSNKSRIYDMLFPGSNV